ncbi:MAG: ATP-binding domain-containing protein, partial [Culicoidibacterales bacterium]
NSFQMPNKTTFNNETKQGIIVCSNQNQGVIDKINTFYIESKYKSIAILRLSNTALDQYANYGFEIVKKLDNKKFPMKYFINKDKGDELLRQLFTEKNAYTALNNWSLDDYELFKAVEKWMSEPNLGNSIKLNEVFTIVNTQPLFDFEFEASMSSDLSSKEVEKYYNNLCSEKVAMTIHGSKGLEFDIVILNKDDFYFRGEFNKELFYVAVTRAKNVVIFLV